MQVVAVPYVLFLIFTIAVVISVVIQAGVFLGLFFVARTAITKAETIANEATGKALPILVQVRTIVEDLSPKIRVISANVADISTTLRDQTSHVNDTVGEVVDKTRTQAQRVDDMVSAVLDGVSHASATIQHGVSKPVRQVSGIIEGLRVGFETLLSGRKAPTNGATRYPSAADDVRERATTSSVADL